VGFREIAETTQSLASLYENSVQDSVKVSQQAVQLNNYFIEKCEELSNNLTQIETLSKRVSGMRRFCEELEKKLLKVKKLN